jgi:hypothetical protein
MLWARAWPKVDARSGGSGGKRLDELGSVTDWYEEGEALPR